MHGWKVFYPLTGHDTGVDTSVACDPHFYLSLANGGHMCFSVQGESNFAFIWSVMITSSLSLMLSLCYLLRMHGGNAITNVSTFLGWWYTIGTHTKMLLFIYLHNTTMFWLEIPWLLSRIIQYLWMCLTASLLSCNVNTNNQTTKLTKDESAWLYISTEGFGIKVRFYKKQLESGYVLYYDYWT